MSAYKALHKKSRWNIEIADVLRTWQTHLQPEITCYLETDNKKQNEVDQEIFRDKGFIQISSWCFFEPKSIQTCYVYETRTADHWNQGGEGLLGFSMLRSLFTWLHDRKLLPLCWKFLKLYPQFPFWILIVLDKIYFACIVLIRAKLDPYQ